MRYHEIVEAVRPFHLYHATDSQNALDILRDDAIHAATTQEIAGRSVQGVSLTRSKYFAENYNDVVLVLDGEKLKQRKKLVPFVHPYYAIDGTMPRAESEEFAIGPIEGLDRYLLAVYVSPNTIYGVTPQEMVSLRRHPKFRR